MTNPWTRWMMGWTLAGGLTAACLTGDLDAVRAAHGVARGGVQILVVGSVHSYVERVMHWNGMGWAMPIDVSSFTR